MGVKVWNTVERRAWSTSWKHLIMSILTIYASCLLQIYDHIWQILCKCAYYRRARTSRERSQLRTALCLAVDRLCLMPGHRRSGLISSDASLSVYSYLRYDLCRGLVMCDCVYVCRLCNHVCVCVSLWGPEYIFFAKRVKAFLRSEDTLARYELRWGWGEV